MKKEKIILFILIIILIISFSYFFFSNSAKENVPCKKGGEIAFNDETGELNFCCENLQEVLDLPDGNKEECVEFESLEKLNTICTDCGNGICEDWENKCICPKDCK